MRQPPCCASRARDPARGVTLPLRVEVVPAGIPLPARIAVTHRLECGSHPAAPAVLAIRRRALRFTHGPQRRGACSSHPSDLTIRDELAVREQWRGSQASSLPISLLSYPVTLVQVMEEHKR
ncbi:hypothetical protein [Chloroflexus sp.]|uniref:hypothetical protein n=1 Tax=Chloroflexus sp. TaxID=1904827 RepID=UPI00257D2C7B|nr:hypothetical protein [Chloroflexus sp.]